jgi:hypothetical protein
VAKDWFTHASATGRNHFFFLGDSVTAQLPWAFVCALAVLDPKLLVVNFNQEHRRFAGTMVARGANGTSMEVVTRVKGGSNAESLYANKWYLPAFNVTLSYGYFHKFKETIAGPCHQICWKCDPDTSLVWCLDGFGVPKCDPPSWADAKDAYASLTTNCDTFGTKSSGFVRACMRAGVCTRACACVRM